MFFNSCKTKNNIVNTDKHLVNESKLSIIKNSCPENGDCEIKIYTNKTIILKQDGIGKMYPKMIDGTNTIYEYKFIKENQNNYQDGNEYEIVFFELCKNSKKLLKDTELIGINAIFGKFCFCRDIAGYYKINNGTFIFEKQKIKFNFSVPKVGERQHIKSLSIRL